MSRDLAGAAILGIGMAVVFAVALTNPRLSNAGPDIWVVTASDKISSRPQLVRAAAPRATGTTRIAASE
jgi:hypothetical protein